MQRIVVPTPFPVGPVNVWLLRGDPVTLIDTGPKTTEALAALEGGLAEAGLRSEDVELVVLTHQHHDHVGLAGVVRERSGCAVAAHELLAPRLADLAAAQKAEDDYVDATMRLHGIDDGLRRTMRAGYRSRRALVAPVEVDVALRDGATLHAGGRELRVAFRPGHSPSDVVLVDEDDGRAFAGDHLLASVSSNPYLHRPLAGSDDPRQRSSPVLAYLDSLVRTARDELEVIHMGHGPDVHDHAALITERLDLHRRRAAQVGAQLRAGPRTAAAIARELWPDVHVSQTYFALSEALGALDLLARDGRVWPEESGGVVSWSRA